jgi:hypothetical protein
MVVSVTTAQASQPSANTATGGSGNMVAATPAASVVWASQTKPEIEHAGRGFAMVAEKAASRPKAAWIT